MCLEKGDSLAKASAMAGMSEKTARKWSKSNELPSETVRVRTWRTREDPLREVWREVVELLENEPELQATTVFEYLQDEHEGCLQSGQLRTLQRRMKQWKALHGEGKEAFFPQDHVAGELAESDFTHMTSLGITIGGAEHPHLLFHFVLTYSNWEACTICYSETFESLSEGLQNALWKLGGVPKAHRTDQLSAAVRKDLSDESKGFTDKYSALLSHYGLRGEKTQPASPNENGDVEQSHHRLKERVDQALMLRGSRDFATLREYGAFLQCIIDRGNSARRERLEQERGTLRPLPSRRVESCSRVTVRVDRASTIRVAKNTYSVNSRLIGEKVQVHLYANHLDVWYAQKRVEAGIARLRGESGHAINYRHVIDSLLRKPGAFANYRYRDDLFPTTRFRMALDALERSGQARPEKAYLQILELAAKNSESDVDAALGVLLQEDKGITPEAVARRVDEGPADALRDVHIEAVKLDDYDRLLGTEAAE